MIILYPHLGGVAVRRRRAIGKSPAIRASQVVAIRYNGRVLVRPSQGESL